MPTVQGAGSVIPTITAGNETAVYAQANAVIQGAMSTVVGGNALNLGPTGNLTGVVVSTPFAVSVSTYGFTYFIVGDDTNQVNVTAGGAFGQTVILGMGPMSLVDTTGSGTIIGGDGNKAINTGTGSFAVFTGAGNDTITASQ